MFLEYKNLCEPLIRELQCLLHGNFVVEDTPLYAPLSCTPADIQIACDHFSCVSPQYLAFLNLENSKLSVTPHREYPDVVFINHPLLCGCIYNATSGKLIGLSWVLDTKVSQEDVMFAVPRYSEQNIVLLYYLDSWRLASYNRADSAGFIANSTTPMACHFWGNWSRLEYSCPQRRELCYTFRIDCTRAEDVAIDLLSVANIETLQAVDSLIIAQKQGWRCASCTASEVLEYSIREPGKWLFLTGNLHACYTFQH